MKVLFVGETWHVHVTESKGFDVFSFDYYEQAVEHIQRAVEACGHEFHHVPCHMVEASFPPTVEGLKAYDVVMVSDVGANTFQLPMNAFQKLRPTPNRLENLRQYVQEGGAFVMIGGYLTFQGIQGRGCYRNTPIEEMLPVNLLPGDDRVEKSQGVTPQVAEPDHPIMQGVPESWPQILGYNQLLPKEGAQVLATVGKDPIITVGEYGQGRVCAYATDCAPHWSPLDFCQWEGYQRLWGNILQWLTERKGR